MINVHWLGQVAYQTAWDQQKEYVQARLAAGPDRLLLLEHPPTYTHGRRADLNNLLYDEPTRQQHGITLFAVDRGGDITYHGPGQLVGYPILNIKQLHQQLYDRPRPDLHQYLRDLEETLILTLAQFGLRGWRYPGYTGVWLTTPHGPQKVAAIGIKVSAKGITSHGFALNINPNLAHFEGIIPCGIDDHGVTSMTARLGLPLTSADIIPHFLDAFHQIFKLAPTPLTPLPQPLPA
ncbi:MAG TPA: lipoyl(octanoyl) transferase LipB [Anaerolineae bacterium]|nr:lipoyl(octanoyl) transferase LipB [Anaerolineae bacterium]